jgi:hypothetical protein
MASDISTTQAHGLRPSNLDDFAKFGRLAANTAFVPKDFRGRPEDCTLAAMFGAELGLGPMQSLQSIAVVNGRPTVWGDAALALVRASGLCVTVEEGVEGQGDDRAGFCIVQRKGEKAQKRVFTVAQAKQAGLWGKAGPWQAYSERMLQLRARGFALRDVFADVLRGMVTAEEAADYQITPTIGSTVEYRPKFDTAPVDEPEAVAVVEPVKPVEKAEDRVASARAAIARASTLDRLEKIRDQIIERRREGVFTDAEAIELCDLAEGKIDFLNNKSEEIVTP